MSLCIENGDGEQYACGGHQRPDVEPEPGSTSAAFKKESADRVIVGETNRAIEGVGRPMHTVELPQQVSANGPVGLVADYRMCIDFIQQRQSCLRPSHFGMRGRARHCSAD